MMDTSIPIPNIKTTTIIINLGHFINPETNQFNETELPSLETSLAEFRNSIRLEGAPIIVPNLRTGIIIRPTPADPRKIRNLYRFVENLITDTNKYTIQLNPRRNEFKIMPKNIEALSELLDKISRFDDIDSMLENLTLGGGRKSRKRRKSRKQRKQRKSRRQRKSRK